MDKEIAKGINYIIDSFDGKYVEVTFEGVEIEYGAPSVEIISHQSQTSVPLQDVPKLIDMLSSLWADTETLRNPGKFQHLKDSKDIPYPPKWIEIFVNYHERMRQIKKERVIDFDKE